MRRAALHNLGCKVNAYETDVYKRQAFEGGAGGAGGFDFSGMDFGDIFGDIFGDFFGGGASRRGPDNGPRRGANLRARAVSYTHLI